MRGRASGLGARISSMVGLLAYGGDACVAPVLQRRVYSWSSYVITTAGLFMVIVRDIDIDRRRVPPIYFPFGRIVYDVLANPVQGCFVANDVFVIIALPDGRA